MKQSPERPWTPRRNRLHEIIFEADTPAGKAFDVVLLILIVISLLVVILESVADLNLRFHRVFITIEWILTILFTIEYILRLYTVRRPLYYATSFFGVIDLLAILPTYLVVIFSGAQYFLVIRALRLLRIFRIFKLGHFLKEGDFLMKALRASRIKISIFLFFIVVTVTIIGALMYVVEGTHNPGFSSMPRSIYWTIVTLTTVGFGDITPNTSLGQFIASIVMVLGYAVIAVPTGIVSAEMVQQNRSSEEVSTQACPACGQDGHTPDAVFCKYCGHAL